MTYYERGGISLHLGDAFEVLPSLDRGCADVVVTDPPYGVNWQSHRRTETFGPIQGDDGSFDAEAMFAGLAHCLRPRRHAYIFGPFAPPAPFRAKAELVWDKAMRGHGDLTLPWGPGHELITFAVRASHKGQSQASDGGGAARLRQGSVIRVPRPNAVAVKRHPTEKPVALLRRLIESSSLLGETVLDPFVGSGSTLVAAIAEGRSAIAVELVEKYAEIAAQRVEAALDHVASGEAVFA